MDVETLSLRFQSVIPHTRFHVRRLALGFGGNLLVPKTAENCRKISSFCRKSPEFAEKFLLTSF